MQLPTTRLKSQSSFLRNIYSPHKERLANIKPMVDDRGPPLRVDGLLRSYKLLGDMIEHNKIHCENFRLMAVLNKILRLPFKQGKYSKKVIRKKGTSKHTSAGHNKNLKIQRDNVKLKRRLEAIRCGYSAEMKKSIDKASKNRIDKFKLPTFILQKYKGNVQIPQEPRMQYKLFRPCIHFDLLAVDERNFGCLTFQLYTEACPMVVLELVRFFMNNHSEELLFPHIYPTLWAECEIPVNMGRFSQVDKLEYDMRALDNASASGIISFDVQSLKYQKFGILPLAISFKPLSVVNGKRIAIGRILNGRKKFSGLREYGRKNGKTIKKIIATHLGVIDSEICSCQVSS